MHRSRNLGCSKFSLGSIRAIRHDRLQDGSPGRYSGCTHPNGPTTSECAVEDASRPTALAKRNSGPPNGPAIQRTPLRVGGPPRPRYKSTRGSLGGDVVYNLTKTDRACTVTDADEPPTARGQAMDCAVSLKLRSCRNSLAAIFCWESVCCIFATIVK